LRDDTPVVYRFMLLAWDLGYQTFKLVVCIGGVEAGNYCTLEHFNIILEHERNGANGRWVSKTGHLGDELFDV
jgi:hypothetical protein